MVASIADINKQIYARAQPLNLEIDCGADGAFNAKIAVISEYPGERERMMKMPLVGSSGKLLWDTVRKYGINRRMVYLSNVVKRQMLHTGVGKGAKANIEANEVSLYTTILQWELNQLPNLEVVVCLGNYALQALTGLTGITNYRGSVMDVQLTDPIKGTKRVVKVVAMINPATVLRDASQELMFKFDCHRLNEVVTGKFEPYYINEIINPTFEEAMAWIEKMRTEGKPVGLDIETSSGETTCIGLANSPYEGMCINLRDATANRWSHKEERSIWEAIQRLVTDEGVRLVMQNGMYDSSWLWFVDRCKVTSYWFDTMLAHHTLYPIMPHGLGFLTTQYTNHPYYKDEGKLWKDGGNIDSEWRYNVKDVCIMLKVAERELKELEDQGLSDFYFSHVATLQPELVDMTVHGVLIDKERKDNIAAELRIKVSAMQQEYFRMVQDLTGEEDYKPNPKSPKQMAELFFKKLRLVGRGTATDKENRDRMRAHHKTPEAAQILLTHIDDMAAEQKFLSTYAEMTIDDDGRGRTEYKQMGVKRAPGRLSSAQTGWNTGSNFQNQPGRAHEMFIADDGYEFSYFDLAQAEARYVGWRYVIHSWIDQFELARTGSGYDAHRALASEMFNVPYDQVPTEDWDDQGKPTIRYIAKRCRHGLNYRMMAPRLATTLKTSLTNAEYLWHLYHKINPELQIGWEHDVKTVRELGKLYNSYGRRWLLQERFSEEATESIVAFAPQSSIGDKVTRVIRQCHNDPRWPRDKARICLNIHDALIALNTHDTGPLVRSIMKEYAEEPIPVLGIDGVTRDMIIPCDFKVSVPDANGTHRWSTLSKIKG